MDGCTFQRPKEMAFSLTNSELKKNTKQNTASSHVVVDKNQQMTG